MRLSHKLLLALALPSIALLAGCPETEEPKTCSSGSQSWGYNTVADRCEQRESCGSIAGLVGEYPSREACQEDRISADAGPNDATDGSTDDAGMEDADESGDAADASTDTSGGSDAADTADGATADTQTAGDGGMDSGRDTGSTPDATADAGADSGPVTCSSQGTNACFSNNDCASGERCEDISSSQIIVPCCVPGERGMKSAGEVCDAMAGQVECKTAVCIAGSSGPPRCSKTCQSAADCPEKMKKCQRVFGSGSSDKWCFPTG